VNSARQAVGRLVEFSEDWLAATAYNQPVHRADNSRFRFLLRATACMCIARHGQNRCIAARTPAPSGIPNGHEGDPLIRSGRQYRQTANGSRSRCFAGFSRSVPRKWRRTAGTGPQPTSDAGAGGLLGGLSGLLNKLQLGRLGNVTNSWVGSGENQPVSPGQLGSALGPNIIKTLAQQSGLSEEELTKQLSQVLPGIVDKLTPSGRLPTAAELSILM